MPLHQASLRLHSGAESFLLEAGEWLLRREEENNLILAIATRLRTKPDTWGHPVYLATLFEGETLVGCACRTGAAALLLTELPELALVCLADDLAARTDALPGVTGPPRAARRFAALWCTRKKAAGRPGLQLRVYAAGSIALPRPPPRGALRRAREGDAALLAEWIAHFRAEAHVQSTGSGPSVEERIRHGACFFWEDGAPVSMAMIVGRTPHGARLGGVYTPPPLRGRGYASACVGELSQQLLREGARFCFLYTDRANPVSNGIYARLGYRPFGDAEEWHFTASP